MVILQRPMTLVHCYSIWRLFDRLWLNIYIKDNKKNSDQNVHHDSWQRTASEMTFVHLMFNSLAIITVKKCLFTYFCTILLENVIWMLDEQKNAIKS